MVRWGSVHTCHAKFTVATAAAACRKGGSIGFRALLANHGYTLLCRSSCADVCLMTSNSIASQETSTITLRQGVDRWLWLCHRNCNLARRPVRIRIHARHGKFTITATIATCWKGRHAAVDGQERHVEGPAAEVEDE